MLACSAARKYTDILSSKRSDVVNDYACQVTRPRDRLLPESLTSYSYGVSLKYEVLCCQEARELDRSLNRELALKVDNAAVVKLGRESGNSSAEGQ